MVAVLLLGGIGVFALTRNASKTNTPAETTQPTAEAMSTEDAMTTASPDAMMEGTASASGAQAAGTVKTFTVTGSNFKFAPATMSVNKGDTVRVTFKNSGGVHDFTIDELNVVTKQISTGAEETVEFVANQAGTFEYYCSVGNHREMGMKGTLTVK